MNGVQAEVMNGETQAQPRGIKRLQDDSVDDDQRFTKRFHLLNLDNNNNRLYVPVPTQPAQLQQQAQQAQQAQQPKPNTKSGGGTEDDYMQLDDTKDRVYIHNLDDELSDIESSEPDRLIFLPDIEKQLSKIPKHVLTGENDNANSSSSASSSLTKGQELVLYAVPSSLSVPAEKDSVRKAILESRRRAMDKSARDAAEMISRGPDNPEIAHGLDTEDYLLDDEEVEDDPDAMEIE
ncbi:hypothetical protein AAFC00_001735 [Neodothiora populina]|uniref:Uncharacterized protein n=1 Tax=Neodothiora populina TaxID=2781224 RepID=A0ABR3PPZ4_9PEZI